MQDDLPAASQAFSLMRAFFIPRISFDTRTSGAMNEQIIFTVFEVPFAMRLAFDDPFVHAVSPLSLALAH